MEFLGLKVPSLLDSGSMVTLIHEAYLNKHILPLLCSSVEELAKAHSLFHLSAANNQDMPVSKYFEAGVMILGFHVPSVWFLVIKDPNTVLESQYSTQMPGVIRMQSDPAWVLRSLGRCLGLRLSKPSHALKRSIL